MTFEEIVANFIPSSVAEVTSAIASGKDMIVFLGRSSCPYCRRFAPKLAQVATDNQKTSILWIAKTLLTLLSLLPFVRTTN